MQECLELLECGACCEVGTVPLVPLRVRAHIPGHRPQDSGVARLTHKGGSTLATRGCLPSTGEVKAPALALCGVVGRAIATRRGFGATGVRGFHASLHEAVARKAILALLACQATLTPILAVCHNARRRSGRMCRCKGGGGAPAYRGRRYQHERRQARRVPLQCVGHATPPPAACALPTRGHAPIVAQRQCVLWGRPVGLA